MKKTAKVVELQLIANIIGNCKNEKEIKNPSSVVSIIRLIKNINKIIAENAEEQKKILETYEVPQVEKEGNLFYEWKDLPKDVQEKIVSSLNILAETEHEVSGFNELEEEDFVIYTKGLETNVISFLWDFLVKE